MARQLRTVQATPTLRLDADASFADQLAIVDTMFVSTTPETAVQKFLDIENPAMSWSVLLAAAGACKGATTNLRAVTDVRGSVPEEWMVNRAPNFTMFAVLGHVFFSIDPSLFSAGLQASYNVYRAKLGGAANIKAFGASGSIEGKEQRALILRKYAAMPEVTPETMRLFVAKIRFLGAEGSIITHYPGMDMTEAQSIVSALPGGQAHIMAKTDADARLAAKIAKTRTERGAAASSGSASAGKAVVDNSLFKIGEAGTGSNAGKSYKGDSVWA